MGVSPSIEFFYSLAPPCIDQAPGTLKPELLVLKIRCLGHRLEDDKCISNRSVICPEEHRPPGAPGNEMEVIVAAQLISSVNTPHMPIVVINAEV